MYHATRAVDSLARALQRLVLLSLQPVAEDDASVRIALQPVE